MSRLWFLFLLLIGLLLPVASYGDGFVLIAGKGFLGDREVSRVVITVRDGKIVSVTEGHPAIPKDLPVVEYRDGYVSPGLIAAAGNLSGPHRASESVGAGYRAVDAYDRYGDYRLWLAAGITTAHIGPGEHRLLSGQGAVVKLAGPPGSRVLEAAADLTLQLGDPADNPPDMIEFPFPPSSDTAIKPQTRQRPDSRLGRLLGLREEIERAGDPNRAFDFHADALAKAWNDGRPLRIAADRGVDILAGLLFISAQNRSGYIVGGAELDAVLDSLRRSPVPVIYRPSFSLRGAGRDLGVGRDVIEAGFPNFHRSHGSDGRADFPLGIGPPRTGPAQDLRLGAVLAHRHGLGRVHALAAVCAVPAAALGVADRVGRIAPGLHADLVVWNADPLSISAQPIDVFVNGRRAWQPARQENVATVIRADTIWVGPDRTIRGGEILIEDGKIVSVGSSVSHPPHARIVDGGAGSFLSPGFIDARGHLGLRGDAGSVGTGDRLSKLLGVPDDPERRVAGAGVTTVILSPYAIGTNGSVSAAVKTWGRSRDQRILRDAAAVLFAVSGDPIAVKSGIRRALGRGKKYLALWQKYEKDLAEWKEKTARGEKVEAEEEAQEETTEVEEDRVTGVWEGTLTGGPIPEPQTGKASLKLSGNQVEGRIIDPPVPVDHRIVLTLEGNRLTGTIEADMDLPDTPRLDLELGDDTMSGKLTVMGLSIDIEATRISKEAVEYKVTRRRKSRKDGKPTEPTVDPSLEPLKDLLEKRIPAVVQVNGVDRIGRILDLFLDEEKLPVILLGADGARLHSERLAEKQVGVVVPVAPLGTVRGRVFHPSDHYSRAGIPIAFQSAAGDGARDLPLRVLLSVERGLAADAALAALTTGPARMYKLEERIGSLEPGRDADVLLFSGHPFRDGGRLERVWINGEEVE